MPQSINYNALGQAIDTTWGRSSTPMNTTQSVKFSLDGANRMIISYITVVSFVSEIEMIKTKQTCITEAQGIIKECIAACKARYKELCSKSLNIKEESSSDSLEIINFNVHNPKRSAYYRRKVIVEIS